MATMELTRADNLLKLDKEIHSRRKRTWFKTEREKKMTKAKEFATKKAREMRFSLFECLSETRDG